MPDITMPQLGETVTEGTIIKWHKQVGDKVAEDETLFEVSTDKVDSEVPSSAAGYVSEILVGEGETVDVGAKLAVLSDQPPSGAEDKGDARAAAAPEAEAAEGDGSGANQPDEPAEAEADKQEEPSEASEPAKASAPTTPAKAESPNGKGSGKLLSPVVRRLIAEHELDPDQIQGSGQGGRITRADVLAHIDQEVTSKPAAAKTDAKSEAPSKAPSKPKPQDSAAAPAAKKPRTEDDKEIVPFSNIRRRTAEHMVRSAATSAHVLTATEVDFFAVDRVRAKVKNEFKATEGFSLTYLPFIARAIVDAMVDFPHVNASVGEDELIVHKRVHLGIAVDLNFEGLIVPVIHDADSQRLRAIARAAAELARRARSRELTADDISGGTFTITNPGPFGTFLTSPIINQPQVAILATDGVKKRPVAVELPDGGDGIAVHPVGNLSLTFDHRAFDGAYAAAFITRCKEILETRELVRRAVTLRVRWLGRVRYRDAQALQQALFDGGGDDYLLLLEHPHVYTLGRRGSLDHVLVPPESVGAELVATNRGGDVTYHGPGQLVGYPILTVPVRPGATPAYIRAVEQVVIDVCADFGLTTGRIEGFPGVWVEPEGDRARKICAIGVRRSRGRTMHGFAFNVDPDLSYFDHIVPCGIADKGVTSLAAEGVTASMSEVVEAVVARAIARWAKGPSGPSERGTQGPSGPSERGTQGSSGPSERGTQGPSGPSERGTQGPIERQSVSPVTMAAPTAGGSAPPPAGGRPTETPVRLLGRLATAGVDGAAGVGLAEPKPAWLRRKAEMGPEYRELKRTMRALDLVTVCEEAGCPNIFECWGAGTATFMINGDRCTRACGFCLVDTRRPGPADPAEPDRVAEAVATMGLGHAVVTAVARDDLPDGGAAAFAATIAAVRRRCPDTTVEVLIPDFKGAPDALDVVFEAGPDVLNHNLETVARLQRAVRPQASYARSLAVLARAGRAGLTTKSGIILGMGEHEHEVVGAMADLRNVGCSILTLGQYLRPTAAHLPVARWWHPDDFDRLRRAGEAMGFAHVQASPLTRSSYHAREAAEAVVAPV